MNNRPPIEEKWFCPKQQLSLIIIYVQKWFLGYVKNGYKCRKNPDKAWEGSTAVLKENILVKALTQGTNIFLRLLI